MRTSLSAPRRAAQRAALALALCVATVPGLAAPGDGADPIGALLVEHGVVAAPAADAAAADETARPGLLRQVHDRAQELTLAAMELVGVRYRRGGTSVDTGFDCSGFTRHVFEMSLGLVLPRRVDEQAKAPGLVAVRREDLKPGDLVFFNTLKRTFSHVGIYIGGGRFIHSPRPGSSVRTENLSFAYWAKRFTGARRAETMVAVDPTLAAPLAAAGSGGS